MNKAHLSRFLVITSLFTIPVQTSDAALVWTIVDPARDMNWELKSFKSYMVLAEKKLAHIDRMLGDKLLSGYKTLNAESNTSALIRAATTSLSITQNNRAERQYEPTASNLLCSMMEVNNNSGLTCTSIQTERTREIKTLEVRFKNPAAADGLYFRNLVQRDGLSTESDEKEIIKSIARDIQTYTQAVTDYQLIDKEDYKRIVPINDMLFDWGVTLPNPSDLIENPFNRDAYAFKPAFDSATSKGFVKRSIRDRFQGSSQFAIDAELINIGKQETIDKLVEDITKAEMKEDAMRLYAVAFSKDLRVKHKALVLALRQEAAAALKAKELTVQ